MCVLCNQNSEHMPLFHPALFFHSKIINLKKKIQNTLGMKLIIRLSFATVYFLKNNNENIYLQKNAQKTSLWEAIHTPTRRKKKKRKAQYK